MEKLTISIDPETWGNLITKYQPHSPSLKETDFSQGTINLDTDTNGSLTKRKGGPNYNQTLLAAPTKDQYEAIFSDGARHLLVVANGEIKYSSGDTIFNTVVNGTGYNTSANYEFATTQDRVYGCNKVNAPIVYDRIAVYGGAAPVTVPRIKNMGAQVPVTAPSGSIAAGGSVPIGAHRYKVTYIYYDAEESNGGPSSSVLTTTGGNQTINLTAIPIGGYGVTQRGLYRDNNDGNFVLLTYITDNTTTVYSDILSVGVTPLPILDNQGLPPTFGLITNWLNRLWLAQVPGDPYTLFYSEADQPDIYGAENQLLCNQEDPITAIVVYFDRLVVFNRRSMGQILGSDPDSFRYAAIPSSVGCVDNRTLQTHVLHGVPVLLWLSERGFYTYDGNSIEYISDPIEDLVNYNIRQAIQQKNSNTISSQAQFQSGTSSNGIDLGSLPGSVTTKGFNDGQDLPGTNPRRNLDDNTDWKAAGAVINNLALEVGDNKLRAITSVIPTLTSGGSLTGDMVYNSTPRLTTFANFTGQGGYGNITPDSGDTYLAQKTYALARAGTVTSVSTTVYTGGDPLKSKFRIVVWEDSGGVPGAVLATSPEYLVTSTNVFAPNTFTFATNIARTAGQFVHIGIQRTIYNNDNNLIFYRHQFVNPLNGGYRLSSNGTSWYQTSAGLGIKFTFTQNPVPKNGAWTSDIFNINSINATQATLNVTYLSLTNFGTKGQSFIVEASTDGIGFTQIYTNATLTSFSASISLSGQRYFRFRLLMSTTDDRETNALTVVQLIFPSPVDWISAPIDCTSDVTAYNSLDITSSVPSGTSLAVTVATSLDNITYSAFGPIGSATVRRYIKIKATLTKNGNGTATPTVTSLILKWTIVANLISPIIDTAVNPPAGWDVFLAQYALNGGSIVFQMRSAATSGGIPAAIFQTVTPNEFPSLVTPLQFVQWKIILTSSDLAVPIVDSMTVQWFISIVASVRPASIFVDGRYYVALAELNQDTNNLIIQLDLNAKWRRFAGLSISTFSFFFNRPYFGLSTAGQIRKFLEGTTDAGTPIEFDVRTKAFDFSTPYKDVSEKQKIVGEVIIHAHNSGAAIQVMYSVDEGKNWYPMYDLNGNSTYQTDTSDLDFFLRVKPSWTNGAPIAGQHLMYRIYNNDEFVVQVHTIKMTAMIRKQPPVITG
jgi:hypothetical protein